MPEASQRVLLRAGALAAGCVAVGSGLLRPFDHAAASWLASIHTPALDDAVRAVTLVGSSAGSAVLGALLAVVHCRRCGARSAGRWIGMFVAGLVLAMALRLAVGQWRPDAVVPASMALQERLSLLGFPSGHAFRSAFLLVWAARLWPGARWFFLVATVLVGCTRPYLNRHWASDILGAWLVAWLMVGVVDWMRARSRA